MQEQPARLPRNLVVCLDGTNNEPETGTTNVARIFQVAIKDDDQLTYYDPGVGTMGSRAAVTDIGKKLSRLVGLVGGFGVKDDLEEAYTWLAHRYRPGDRVFLFGFSRGAYTARALCGMLRTVGLLRGGAENLVPYALKLYAQSGKKNLTREEERAFWKVRRDFREHFGNPGFPHPYDSSAHQIQFLGVWDTVKSVGWLNWKAQIEQAHWPFTHKHANVCIARHALAVDERRRPYTEYRFDRQVTAASDGRHAEVWFPGAHSDVGGQFADDHKLSDIAFFWMVREAAAAGLRIDPKIYKKLLSIELGAELPEDTVLGKIHPAGWMWGLLGSRERAISAEDVFHPSVRMRMELDSSYSPRFR
jgi:uncharacterized protein (DUF2235 family)